MASIKSDESCNYFIFTNKEYNNLNWIKKHEFRYKGEMYDVLSEKIHKDGVVVYCYHDKKDSWLYNELAKQNSNSSANSGKARNMQRLLQSVTFVYIAPLFWEPIVMNTGKVFYNDKINNYSSFISEVISPPPQYF